MKKILATVMAVSMCVTVGLTGCANSGKNNDVKNYLEEV